MDEQFPLKAASAKISALAATKSFGEEDQSERTAALSHKPKLGRPFRKVRHSKGKQAAHHSKKNLIEHKEPQEAF
jgi:hypothetical protein